MQGKGFELAFTFIVLTAEIICDHSSGIQRNL